MKPRTVSRSDPANSLSIGYLTVVPPQVFVLQTIIDSLTQSLRVMDSFRKREHSTTELNVCFYSFFQPVLIKRDDLLCTRLEALSCSRGQWGRSM